METQVPTFASNRPQSSLGTSFLRFQLDDQTPALLSMEHAQEVLVVPVERLTTMPNMPDCVLGLLNRRSRVLWMIDLAKLLGLEPLSANLQRYNVAIIRVGPTPLALAVQEVKGVTRFSLDLIQSPRGSVPSNLLNYLQGCILQVSEIILVLDAVAIAHAPALHSS
ncbi:MAG: chemotaxis protein CheW [Leptolyngbyaceae bacterium]|nr:chemotaxis protein CheW [Leptolyngbyaceae bacterium]